MRRGRVKSTTILAYACHLCNYQVSICKCSKHAYLDIPNPVGFRWTTDVDTGNPTTKWISLSSAPDTAFEVLSCKCQRFCVLLAARFTDKLASTNMCTL